MQFTYRRQPVPSIGRAALRRGLSVGLVHGVVSTFLTVLALTVLAGLSGPLTLLSFPIACAFFLVAGLLVARQTQRVAGGTLAGLWTALISKLLSILLVTLFDLIYLLPRQPQPGGQIAPLVRLAPFFALEFLYLCLDAGLGAGFGALGGLLGKDREQKMSPNTEPVAVPSPRVPYMQPPAQPAQSTGSTKAVKPSDPSPYGTPFFPPPYPVSPSTPGEDLYKDRADYK